MPSLAWHCTRLTDAEIRHILRDGMQLLEGDLLSKEERADIRWRDSSWLDTVPGSDLTLLLRY